jgi:hypothetical protein
MKNQHDQNRNDTFRSRRPDPREVQRRAYELYMERGGQPGQELEDWFQAERELKENGELTAAR